MPHTNCHFSNWKVLEVWRGYEADAAGNAQGPYPETMVHEEDFEQVGEFALAKR